MSVRPGGAMGSEVKPLHDLRTELLELARDAGFDDAAICGTEGHPEMNHLPSWLAMDCQGDMEFLARGVETRLNPSLGLPGAASIIMVLKSYWRSSWSRAEEPVGHGHGRVSRHAMARDYHKVMRRGLRRLARRLKGKGFQARSFVDTSPVMEKVLAVHAGLGVAGRNTLLLHPRFGSWIVLGGVMTDAKLPVDEPRSREEHPCTNCRECIRACPTGAISSEGFLRADRCLAYWTIECRRPIPKDIGEALGGWLYGCDQCQLVCPANRQVEEGTPADFGPELVERDMRLGDVAALDEEAFAERFQGTSMARIGIETLKRNAKALE